MEADKIIKLAAISMEYKVEYLMMYSLSTWIKEYGQGPILMLDLIIVLEWHQLLLKALFLYMEVQVIQNMLMQELLCYGCPSRGMTLGNLFKIINMRYVQARRLVISILIEFIFYSI